MNITVFLPNWIGDAVMATPTLRALRRLAGRGGRLVGVMKPRVAPVLEGTPWLDEILFYDRDSPDPELGFWAAALRLRRVRSETAVILPNARRTAALAWLGGSRVRAGYRRDRRGWLLTHRLEPPRSGKRFSPISAVDAYLALASAIGCPFEPARLELATTPADEAAADRVWRGLGPRVGAGVVVINSSGAYGPAKLWPDERFAALARRIASGAGHPVLLLCGPAERERATAIAALAAAPGVASLAAHELSIGLSKACVRRSRLLVTTDSGPRHFAAAFGVPVVSLFGPTDVAWSETRHPLERSLAAAVPCGPCQLRTCPEGHHRCMRELTLARVEEAVRALLRETAS